MTSALFRIPNLRYRYFSSSSDTRVRFSRSSQPEVNSFDSETRTPIPNNDIRCRIFMLRFPERSATAVLDTWVREGKKVHASNLRDIAKLLKKQRRYKHALEVMRWMELNGTFNLKAPDHATTLDLITKVCNLSVAESYFNKLSSSSSQKEAAYHLLHGYVKERNLEKAEALMQKLLNSGLAVNPFLFNEMMKLYMATNQVEKVISVIKHMKLSKVPLTVLSYSLWLNASFEVFGASSVEKVYQEMKNDENIKIGWSTYATLANIYTKAGYTDKAFDALRIAEEKLSTNDRLAYSFIMTCYAALKDKNGILRMWECSKKVRKRFTCVNYMSVMSSLIKVGDIESAERIFKKWESQCCKYDIRVSNILLGAYVRNGWMNKAETLHNHTLKAGACPNYKTWEILMEGYFNTGEMDKVVDAMKKGFFKLNGCIWKPPVKIVLAIAEYFEKRGNITEMRSYINILNDLNFMSLPVYKLALRTHIKAQANASDIIEMTERDKVECDDELKRLIECSNKSVNLDGETDLLLCPPPLKSFIDRIFKGGMLSFTISRFNTFSIHALNKGSSSSLSILKSITSSIMPSQMGIHPTTISTMPIVSPLKNFLSRRLSSRILRLA